MDFTDKAVYLSGPMTGHPDWNKPMFDKAEKKLYGMGAKFVFNPTKGAPPVAEAEPHEHYMLVDLHALTQSYDGKACFDYMVLLPGWLESEGATLEAQVAYACGIEAILYGDL